MSELFTLTKRLHLAWNRYQAINTALVAATAAPAEVLHAQQVALSDFRSAQMDFFTLVVTRLQEFDLRLQAIEQMREP